MELVLSGDMLAILFFVALIAGVIDTLAGGGGLITAPALILVGLPPIVALGTNKLQGFIGTATATIMMILKKKVTFNEIKLLMFYAFISSAIGTFALQFINTKSLQFIIPIIIFITGLYFLLMPRGKTIEEPKLTEKTYRKTVVPLIGFYDGMFGPGTGSFFSASEIICRANNLIKATALAKAMNFATDIASVFVYMFYGEIAFFIGGIMMVGGAIGAYIGANFLVKINPEYLRLLVVSMCFLMLIKYIIKI